MGFNYYPNVNHAITIYESSEIDFVSDYHTIARSNSKKTEVFYTHLIDHFAKAEIQAPFQKIGVVFKPLGVNHFIRKPLGKIIQGSFTKQFDPFDKSIFPAAKQVFSVKSAAQKVHALDQFFTDTFVGFEEHRLLDAIQMMNQYNGSMKLETIAETLNSNRKTVNRLFQKHLNCSWRDYNRLIKFRKAIDLCATQLDKHTLTELSLLSNYYDQSDFIKHFQGLTGFSPKHFFRSVTNFSDFGTFWTELR